LQSPARQWITANQPFGAWDAIFPDPAMTLAAVDRLVHHATIFEMNVPLPATERTAKLQTSRPRILILIVALISPRLSRYRQTLVERGDAVSAGGKSDSNAGVRLARPGQVNDILPAFRVLRFGFGIRFILGRDRWCRLWRARVMAGLRI
jgi:hypothetical protein